LPPATPTTGVAGMVATTTAPATLSPVQPPLLTGSAYNAHTDQLTDWRCLVDTGASFSLVPQRSKDPPATEPQK